MSYTRYSDVNEAIYCICNCHRKNNPSIHITACCPLVGFRYINDNGTTDEQTLGEALEARKKYLRKKINQ